MSADVYLRPASRVSWSSIFAGTFVFLAIEITFGVLRVAIFASATNPASANPVGSGISLGLGIWMLILTIIALHFAGRVASSLSAVADRASGMWHGLITYGLCLFTTLLIASMSIVSTASATTAVNPTEGYVVHAITTGGWWLFFILVCGMIAAAVGGAHATRMGSANVAPLDERDSSAIRKIA